jgi:hypothetical protein
VEPRRTSMPEIGSADARQLRHQTGRILCREGPAGFQHTIVNAGDEPLHLIPVFPDKELSYHEIGKNPLVGTLADTSAHSFLDVRSLREAFKLKDRLVLPHGPLFLFIELFSAERRLSLCLKSSED